jgi:hypothetical protein
MDRENPQNFSGSGESELRGGGIGLAVRRKPSFSAGSRSLALQDPPRDPNEGVAADEAVLRAVEQSSPSSLQSGFWQMRDSSSVCRRARGRGRGRGARCSARQVRAQATGSAFYLVTYLNSQERLH